MSKPKKILVIGQTPPPFGGQAMMTQRLIDAKLKGIAIFHVRMNFSKQAKSIGKFSFSKIFHLCGVVGKSIYRALRHKIKTVYYMPVGNSMVPLIRDIMILLFIRPFFKEVIFHFRAAGVGCFVDRQHKLLRALAKYVYRNPDLAIHLSANNPDDGGYFGAKESRVIANGLEDAAEDYLPLLTHIDREPQLLYVGLIKMSKGVFTILKAVSLLKKRGIRVNLSLLGKFYTEETEQKLKNFCDEEGLTEQVEFAGLKVGDEKWRYFLNSDIFCFPSFFESESFGNVVVEAMMFGLPVIGSNWRGIPSIIQDGRTGYVIPPKNPAALAQKIEVLLQDLKLRVEMGKNGRRRFLEYYQLPRFLEDMEAALKLEPIKEETAELVTA